MNKAVAIASIALVLSLGTLFFPKTATNVVERVRPDDQNVGAVPGGDVYQKITAYGALSQGGVFTLATTASSYTLKDRDLNENSVISVSAVSGAQPALTLTLPASTTWSSLPKNGVHQNWVIDDLHTSAATTTTVTAGTGVDIDGPTANDDIINGGVSGILDCWRLPDTNIRCIVQEMVDAG